MIELTNEIGCGAGLRWTGLEGKSHKCECFFLCNVATTKLAFWEVARCFKVKSPQLKTCLQCNYKATVSFKLYVSFTKKISHSFGNQTKLLTLCFWLPKNNSLIRLVRESNWESIFSTKFCRKQVPLCIVLRSIGLQRCVKFPNNSTQSC